MLVNGRQIVGVCFVASAPKFCPKITYTNIPEVATVSMCVNGLKVGDFQMGKRGAKLDKMAALLRLQRFKRTNQMDRIQISRVEFEIDGAGCNYCNIN